MTVYHCYFLNPDRMSDVQLIECAEEQVALRAKTLPGPKTGCRRLVVWRDGRMVVSISWRDMAI